MTIERVRHLVSRHEEGGDEGQNVLCDADCLAFFEEKALRKAKEAKRDGRAEAMKKKLDYVFSRMHSDEAREIAGEWYRQAQEILA